MKMRTQMGIALALVAPAWLVTGNAVAQEQQQTEMQQQQQTQEQAGAQLMNMTAGEIADMALKNDQGQEIGDIEKVVQSKTDGKVHAVVSLGGFLGLGEKQVTVPLDQVQVQEGELIAQGMTKDQLEQQQAYNEQDYEAIEESTTLASVTQGGQMGGGTQVSFQQLDTDQDGNLTEQELQAAPEQLSQNWQQYDTDQNQQLSQSEFSAFEQEQQAQGGQQEGLKFSDLDQDGDGKISREDVREVQQLSQNWSQYDTNNDDALDESEFAAFEQEQQQQPGQMQQQEMEQQQMQQQQGQSGATGEQVSFQQLDTDQDGYIKREDAESVPQLSENWQQYDLNQDDQLDQAEFSAFEQQQQQQQPGQVPGQMPESQMPQEGTSPEGQM